MSEIYLKQPEVTYSTCGPFTKHRERIQKFREAGNLKHLYRNELDEVCFAHDVAYSASKDLTKGTVSDNNLKCGAYEITRNCIYDRYHRALTRMIFKFFDKKTGSGVSINEQIAEELHNQ